MYRILWLCVLPGWKMNVNVNVKMLPVLVLYRYRTGTVPVHSVLHEIF